MAEKQAPVESFKISPAMQSWMKGYKKMLMVGKAIKNLGAQKTVELYKLGQKYTEYMKLNQSMVKAMPKMKLDELAGQAGSPEDE